MKRIISKEVLAYRPVSILEDEYFKNVRRRIFNEDPFKQKEDAGSYKDKKNVLSPTGFGSQWRGHAGVGMDPEESDDETEQRGVGSGNRSSDGPPDDEIGPGNSSGAGGGPFVLDPYAENEVFLKHRLNKGDRDSVGHDAKRNNVNRVLRGTPLAAPHTRYSVDNLN